MTFIKEQKFVPLNSASSDYHSEAGVRFSIPFYIDLSTVQRKQLLNGVRTALDSRSITTSSPSSVSGLSVESANPDISVENYIGMNISVLRTVLFSRGGVPADLILRLQAVSGVEIVTDADLKKAFDQKKKTVLSYVKDNPPPQ